MGNNQRLGDRRRAVRFEIVGSLWGALERVAEVPVHNLGSGGMAVDSTRTLPAGSIHAVRLTLADDVADVRARVCHVTPVADRAGSGRFRIGFEFLDVPPEIGARIDRLVQGRADRER